MKEKISKLCGFLADFSIFAILFSVPIYFSFIYETWNIFELPKLVVFRCLLSIGVLAFFAKIFIDGFFEYRGRRIVFWLLSAVILSWLLSAILSIHPEMSFWGKYSRLQGFTSLLSYAIFFLLVFLRVRGFKKVKIFILSIVSSSLVVSLYGLSQFLYLDRMHWAEPFSLYGRIFSSLGQPNFFGHYLIMVIPISVYCLFFLTKRFLFRFLFVLLISLQLFCLYYTLSRSAWLALIAEVWLAVVLLFAIFRKKKFFWGFLIASVVLSAGALFFILAPNNHNDSSWIYKGRLASSFYLSGGSGKMRLLYWSAASREFASAPVLRKTFGFGQDVLSDVFAKHYSPEWSIDEKINMWPDRAHNLFFDMLLTFGVFGLVVFSVLTIYFVKRIYLFLKKEEISKEYWLMVFLSLSFFGYFVNNLFSFSLNPQYVYLYFFLAIAAFLFFQKEEQKRVNIYFSKISKILLFIFLVVFLGIFVFYRSLRDLKADYYFSASRDQEAISNCGALDFNRTATIMNPEQSIYREEYIYNALNCFEHLTSKEDQEALRQNIEITLSSVSDKEKGYYFQLEEANAASIIAVYFDSAYAAKSEDIFKKLLESYPNVSQIYNYYAYHKLRQKEYDDALDILKKGEELIPTKELSFAEFNPVHKQQIIDELIRFYGMTASVYEAKGDMDMALDYYQKIYKLNPYYLSAYKKAADIFYLKKNFKQAEWYNQRGYSLNRNDYSWPLAIAFLRKESGDKAGALFYAKQAAFLSGDKQEVVDLIKELEK